MAYAQKVYRKRDLLLPQRMMEVSKIKYLKYGGSPIRLDKKSQKLNRKKPASITYQVISDKSEFITEASTSITNQIIELLIEEGMP